LQLKGTDVVRAYMIICLFYALCEMIAYMLLPCSNIFPV